MLAIGMNGMAQTTEGIVERNNNGVISSVKYPREDKIGAVPENAAMFFTNVLKVRNEDSFQLQHSSNAKYGMSFERYTQFYKGIEVDGGFYSFRYKDGRMLAACGNYVLTENLKTIPLITEEAAKSVFAKYMKDKISDIGNCHIKLVITEKPNSKDAVLVYKVFFETSSIPTSEIGFIDANTGDLIYTLPASICYSALGTFYTLYNNSTTKTARTEYVGGNTGYILYDTTRGNGIHTYKWTGNTPSEFNDANNIWTASELGNYQMALDVHWTLQQIYDVLKNEYGHYSFDGADAAIEKATEELKSVFQNRYPSNIILDYNLYQSNRDKLLNQASCDISVTFPDVFDSWNCTITANRSGVKEA
jgi:Zn-dependent metalloprotease